jgi:hypothetical protein
MGLRPTRRYLLTAVGLVAVCTVVWPRLLDVNAAQPDCSRLADDLAAISVATDTFAAARDAGVGIVDGAVRVIVELEPGLEIPADLPGIVEASYQQFVQLLVEPARLCELASQAGVVSVKAPFHATPDAPPPAVP